MFTILKGTNPEFLAETFGDWIFSEKDKQSLSIPLTGLQT